MVLFRNFLAILITLATFALSACSFVPLSTSEPLRLSSDYLEVHFIDVGLGDSIFVRLSTGENILIDTGSPAEALTVVDYIAKLGVSRIDHLIFTHPHDDHIGGVFAVMSEFSVGKLYDNGFSNFHSELYGDYLKAVRADLSRYRILQSGQVINEGSLKIEVLNPLLPPVGKINEDSVAVRMSFGKVKILLAGDMGQISERRLLKSNVSLESQVIKIGHHGENDVCSDAFLSSVSPEAAVISVSSMNKYARPHPELLERLEKRDVKIYRTDVNGHIVLKTDGENYSIDISAEPATQSVDRSFN